jgi:diguanylate cyclase (GGDEF)-like protein/PAS domain S-box-containing protein
MCRKRNNESVMADNSQELTRLRAALAASGDVVYEWILGDDTIHWDGPFQELFGRDPSAEVATGETFNRCVNPQDLPERLKVLSDHFAGQRNFSCEYRLRCGQGQFRWVQDRGAAEFDASGRAVRMTGTLRAIDEHKQLEARLEYMASYDELTGLFNKSRLREGLTQTLSHGARNGSRCAYLVVGIDKLTLINDTFGYETGDAVIVQVGHRLERCLRANDLIGRVGGDRFGIVLAQSSDEFAHATADKILCNVRMSPVKTPSGSLHVTVSIGVITQPETADSAYDIMTKAETALHEAKKQGRNCFISYYQCDSQRGQRRHNIEIAEMVRAALKGGRLTFAYQPIVETHVGKPAYFECLVRMIGDDGKVVPAADFVPVVEQMGMIRLVDRYALEMAVNELTRYPDVKLAINVSGLTVVDDSWMRAFRALLKDKPDLASRLVIEITETAVMQDIEDSARFVAAVRERGCKVALDDFGAGYTSFRHFKSLVVDVVKIDGSFVRKVSENRENQLFVRTLLGFANGFGLESVAECVETAADAELLTALGVKYIQGYYCGRPSMERLWLPEGDRERDTMSDWSASARAVASAR